MSCPLAKYKDIFGKPNEGAHSSRFLGIAIVDAGATIIHLEIWQGQAKQNPALWLVRR